MTKSAGPVLKRLYEEFGEKIEFVTLYIREAHPGDRYPQPKNYREKFVNARVYRERDKIPWTVAVDDIDGTLHRSLDHKANAAYVIGLDGTVAFRALWSNDYATLHDALFESVKMKRGRAGQSEREVVPLMRGMGEMYDTLNFAGGYAKKDLLREIPPMYGMGRIAAFFRPLPPLARVVLAMTAIGTAFGIAVNLLIRGSRRRPTFNANVHQDWEDD